MTQPLFYKEDFAQLARFKLLMRQVHQYTVDLTDLATEPQYAKDTLDLAEDTDHEELMILAIELRARLGLLNQAIPVPTTPPTPSVVAPPVVSEPEAPKKTDRYRFSLR